MRAPIVTGAQNCLRLARQLSPPSVTSTVLPTARLIGAALLAMALAASAALAAGQPTAGRRIGDSDETVAAVAADGSSAALVRRDEAGRQVRAVDLRHGQVAPARVIADDAIIALADEASVMVIVEPSAQRLLRTVPFARDAPVLELPIPVDVEALAIDAGAGHLALAAISLVEPTTPKPGAGQAAQAAAVGPWACVHVVRPRQSAVVQRCLSVSALGGDASARIIGQRLAYARDGGSLWWATSLLGANGVGAIHVALLTGDALTVGHTIMLRGGACAGLRAWPGGGGADVQFARLGDDGPMTAGGHCDALVAVTQQAKQGAGAAVRLTAMAWPIGAGEAAAAGRDGVRFGLGHAFVGLNVATTAGAVDRKGVAAATVRTLTYAPYARAAPADIDWRVADDTGHAAARFGNLAAAFDDSGVIGIFSAASLEFAGADRLIFRAGDGALQAATWGELADFTAPHPGLDILWIAVEIAVRITTRCV